ncbi:MAG: hypothetical protein IH859_05010 [Chloroflexi bacterium]|nr:hypothetical protein [Chloroflexota bacterium]
MKRFRIISLAIVLLVVPLQARAAPGIVGISTFSVTNVVTDVEVTIKTSNFPAGDTFNVRMGVYGTLGIGGILVDTQASGAGGSFNATYAIPAALHGSTRIAIRLESPTSGYYAYNWFWNDVAPAPPAALAPMLIPTFSITTVNEDVDVSIQTSNFPAGDTFNVRIGSYGSLGIGGILVDTQASGAGGNFNATYAIPPALAGATRLAVRLESPTSGYYAYNWFWNNISGGGGIGYPAPGVTPTFSITAVVQDNKVTIYGINFTRNDTYTVRMGAYGTLGIGGVVVASYITDGTGSFTATFTIPAALFGSARIAIRLESDTSAYYSYNWFWNNDAP